MPAHFVEEPFYNLAGSASCRPPLVECLSFLLYLPAEALASLSAPSVLAEHVGRKHRRVSPCSLHHRAGRKSRRPGVCIPVLLACVVVVAYFSYFFR